MSTTAHRATPVWLAFLSLRWKAVAATAVPLIGGVLFLVSTGELDIAHLAGLLAIALGSGVATHTVPNVGSAPIQDTVNAVIDAVPPGIADAVATAVNTTTTGVLAPAVGTVTGVVGGAVNGLLGDKPGD